MKNQSDVLSMIRELSGQSAVLTIPRIFIRITGGDIQSAMFLSQCIYWDGKMRGEFYKTYQDWELELGLTRRDIDRARKVLGGILVSRIKKANGAPTIHYRINYEALEARIVAVLEVGFVRNEQIHLYAADKSLTEDYINIVNDSDDPPASAGVSSSKRKKNSPGDIFDLAEALSDVTGLPLELNKGRLFREAKMLLSDQRVSPALIRILYSDGGAWYKRDWRGQKGSKPNLGNIRETIFKLGADDKFDDGMIHGSIYDRGGDNDGVIKDGITDRKIKDE